MPPRVPLRRRPFAPAAARAAADAGLVGGVRLRLFPFRSEKAISASAAISTRATTEALLSDLPAAFAAGALGGAGGLHAAVFGRVRLLLRGARLRGPAIRSEYTAVYRRHAADVRPAGVNRAAPYRANSVRKDAPRLCGSDGNKDVQTIRLRRALGWASGAAFTLDNGLLTLSVTDYGATAVRLTVPRPRRRANRRAARLRFGRRLRVRRQIPRRNGRPLRQPHRRRRVHARRETVRAYGQRRRQPSARRPRGLPRQAVDDRGAVGQRRRLHPAFAGRRRGLPRESGRARDLFARRSHPAHRLRGARGQRHALLPDQPQLFQPVGRTRKNLPPPPAAFLVGLSARRR